MTTSKIFSHWDETHSQLWNRQPIRLEHEMHKSPAFSMDDLARLIEGYPRLPRRTLAQPARSRLGRWPLS